jgi:putative transposase
MVVGVGGADWLWGVGARMVVGVRGADWLWGVGAQHAAPLPEPHAARKWLGSQGIGYSRSRRAATIVTMDRAWHPRVSMHRRSMRLPGYDYTRPGAYFVTICALTHLFGRIRGEQMVLSPLGAIARECWEDIPNHFEYVRVDAYVVMPDHLHGILILRDYRNRVPAIGHVGPGSLGAVVRSFKSAVAARVHGVRGTRDHAVWQRNYFDRIIRDKTDLDRVRRYIRENPARWVRNRH